MTMGGYSTPICGFQRHTDINGSNKPISLGFAVKHNCTSRVGGEWLEMTNHEATTKVEMLEEEQKSVYTSMNTRNLGDSI